MVQWVQGYRLFPDDLWMVAHTFRSAFPATMTWTARPEDFLLIGQTRQAAIDLDRLKSAFETNPSFRADLERIRVKHWAEMLAYFLLDDAATARFSASGRINDDDRLLLEFSAPRALYLETVDSNRKLLLSHASAALPPGTPESAHPSIRGGPGHHRARVSPATSLGSRIRAVRGSAPSGPGSHAGGQRRGNGGPGTRASGRGPCARAAGACGTPGRPRGRASGRGGEPGPGATREPGWSGGATTPVRPHGPAGSRKTFHMM